MSQVLVTDGADLDHPGDAEAGELPEAFASHEEAPAGGPVIPYSLALVPADDQIGFLHVVPTHAAAIVSNLDRLRL